MPLVIAHRGASADFPENTVAAFEGAVALGADWIELDVRRTADGRLAVHHDAHLPDGRPIVEVDGAVLPEDVPSLARALDACAPLGVNIEIKNSDGEPDFDPGDEVSVPGVLAELAARPDLPVIVSSFNAATVARLHRAAPHVATALLVFQLADPRGTVVEAAAAGHAALHPWHGLVDRALVEQCHELGLAVNVWTVDDPARMTELAALGVDGIVTNEVGTARRTLG